MNFRLHISPPENPSSVIDLAKASLPCVIGRDSEVAQIAIPDSQASRAHASIDRDGAGWAVEDMGSRNGTFLNGAQVTRAPLRHADVLRLGRTQITIEIDGSGPLDPLVGQRLGGFELQEVIGRGRYGTVFRGLQVALGRTVAIKVLAEECRSQPEQVQAFLAEARRAGRLNHPNLVQVHDVCQVGDNYLLIMEIMKGSAADVLRTKGPFTEAETLRLLQHMSRALAYAESQRLVHRDVKPDNILINSENTYKLADLGIAAPITEDGQAHQERIFGSPHYVAPEQARGGAIDGRADLYALGASAWHLLAGEPIYSGSNRQIVIAHLNQPLPDLGKLVPQLSDETADLVCELLEKDPDDRPENADEVARRVDEIIAMPPRTPRSATPRPPRVRRRRRRYRS